jgi:outer membrane protein TolC
MCAACVNVCSCIPDTPHESDFVGPAFKATTTAPGGEAAARPGPTTLPSSGPAETGPLHITVQRAIVMGLEHNRSLAVERLNPAIFRTQEQLERAAFDPVVAGDLAAGRAKGRMLPNGDTIADSVHGGVSATQLLPTGTNLAAGVDVDLLDSSLYSDDLASTHVSLSATQALLRGASVRANLARLNQARIDARISQYELRGFSESLVAGVEEAYWDVALAARQIEILINSLALAEQQLNETHERIKIGRLAETELAAAQAEVALRRENLINARSRLAQFNLRLLRLVNPPGGTLWDRPLVLANHPVEPPVKLDDVREHVAVAMRMRPDLNQARLAVQRNELEVVRTENGLLPRLDAFATVGRSGYAKAIGKSMGSWDGDYYDVLAGVRFEYPPANRGARAQYGRAVLSRQQSLEAVNNLAQLVEVDVRSAYIEVTRAREQIAATAVTRKLQEEKVRAETEKFKVGKSTSLLVAQTQRDLLASQIAEIEAVTTYLKDLVELHRLEGSLLERRGLAAPGREPASMDPAETEVKATCPVK